MLESGSLHQSPPTPDGESSPLAAAGRPRQSAFELGRRPTGFPSLQGTPCCLITVLVMLVIFGVSRTWPFGLGLEKLHAVDDYVRHAIHDAALQLRNDSDTELEFEHSRFDPNADPEAIDAIVAGSGGEASIGDANSTSDFDNNMTLALDDQGRVVDPDAVETEDGTTDGEEGEEDGSEEDDDSGDEETTAAAQSSRAKPPAKRGSKSPRRPAKRPSRSRTRSRYPSVSRAPSRSPPVVNGENSGDNTSPTCGVGEGPGCRHWTWDCDMARVNDDAPNLTWWEAAGSQGIYRMYIHDPQCNTDQLTHEHVSQCLKGKHIMIMGDSISRYSYYNLVQFLEMGKWHPRLKPASEHTNGWRGSFNGMYAGVQKRFNGHEICDCGRKPDFAIENHYYYNPRLGIRVTFVWRTGTNRITFHPLSWIGERCQFSAFLERKVALNRQRWADAVRSKCRQRGCSAGKCAKARGYLQMSDTDGVAYFVSKLQPDALVMNVGLWTDRINRPEELHKLVALGEKLKKINPRLPLIWRTTTWREPNAEQTYHDQPPKVLKAAGWRVSDASGVTQGVRELAARLGPEPFYRDPRHFQPFIYRALNELLLSDLCSTKLEWP